MTAVTVTSGITRWDLNVLCWRQPGGVQKGFDKTGVLRGGGYVWWLSLKKPMS